eukprot:CAMPEP_0198291048 /NCGR_PEP_ID=MMETSP1449-20131203/8704_1 /TAXON_ID=420275 /ORGANISM="Attheya septentrionalis, Strain CCMP2084" /LENGTH=549 /DNA_ID=CAMNT_0043989639 /DNA_START=279 /DNA_END=1928 /DNA_ORIENTATION=-
MQAASSPTEDYSYGTPGMAAPSNNNNDSHNRPTMQQTHVGEFRDDYSNGVPIVVNRATYVYVLSAALNSCNLGYDIGVNTTAGILIQDSMNLSDGQLELFMGSLNFFAMVGALCSSAITDHYGRRGGFVVAAVGFIIGIVIMSFSQSYGGLMFGRVFVGLGVGFGLAIDPLYISEISPAAHRGRLVTWSEIATNVGIVLGFLSGAIFFNMAEGRAWRAMFLMGLILPTIMIYLAIRVMPESPRWLVSKGRESEAKEVLEKVYPPGFKIDAIIDGIKEAIELESEAEHAVGWKMIFFPTPAIRRMLLVGIGTAVAQQAVGIDAIQYFLTFIIRESGIDSRAKQTVILVFLGLLKLVFILIAARLFDTRGRRPLFFISLCGCAAALLLVAFSFIGKDEENTDNSGLAVLGLALYLSAFSLGMGPGAWLIPSEVFAISIRAKAMSLATFSNRLTGTLISSTFLTTANAMSWSGFFVLLAVICLLAAAFLYFFLPETKGRSLEDMSMYFAEITGDNSILEVEETILRRKNQLNLEGIASESLATSDPPPGTMT